MERRLQTFAAVAAVTVGVTGTFISFFIFFWAIICSSWLCVPCILYGLWIYWDRKSAESGHRRSYWVRNWRWWKLAYAYYSIGLVKTSELSPDRSYLFAAFPHGLFCLGGWTFVTDSYNFEKIFPGLTPYAVTLTINFITPFIRELVLALGFLPADEGCMVRTLSKKGKALYLAVGGAEESFHSKPGQYNIIVARRKGFIRVALKSGASLVPTISFGDPEVYDQIQFEPGSFFRRVQEKFKKLTGIAPVIPGVFQYTSGILPFRIPVTVVTGKPIDVPKVENPTKAQIDELHAVYCQHLIALFNSEKEKYLNAPAELNFL